MRMEGRTGSLVIDLNLVLYWLIPSRPRRFLSFFSIRVYLTS